MVSETNSNPNDTVKIEIATDTIVDIEKEKLLDMKSLLDNAIIYYTKSLEIAEGDLVRSKQQIDMTITSSKYNLCPESIDDYAKDLANASERVRLNKEILSALKRIYRNF